MVQSSRCTTNAIISYKYRISSTDDYDDNQIFDKFLDQRIEFEEASSNFDVMEVDIILLAMPSATLLHDKRYSENRQTCT